MPKSKAKSSKVNSGGKSGRDPIADNQSQILKGEYNGEHRTTDFVVSGHSSGSHLSEMGEISDKVARDVNDYGLDRKPEAESETLEVEVSSDSASNTWKIAAWSALGFAGAGILSYVGYQIYSNYKLKQSAIPVFPEIGKYKSTSAARH
ncbi:MAG: hypothetical protein V4692_11900 [Bdellovibrionota bacterium]